MTLAQLGLLLFVLNRLNAKVKEFNGGRQAISLNTSGLVLVKELRADAEASNTIQSGPVTFEGLKKEIVLRTSSSSSPTVWRLTARSSPKASRY